MSRRHVLLDATAARPPLTGVGWSMVELATALAAAAPRDFRFTLVTGAPDAFPAAGEVWSIREHRAGNGVSGLRRRQAEVAACAREIGADLIHCLTMPGLLRAPVPTVVTVHDVAFLAVPQTIELPRRLWYRWAVPRALGRAARIATNSRATAEELTAAYSALGPTVRITPFGTPAWIRGREPAAPVPTPDAPFLFVGALEPRKNLRRVLRALDLVRTRARPGEEPRLHVVGAPGWRNADLLADLERAERAGAVVREGPLPREELWRRLISARALLLPSLHEGFGFPILEGMAAGVPVITSDRGAMRETAGGAALLVDPEDPTDLAAAMERILSDPALAGDLRRRGLDRQAELTWETTAEATLNIYREVLDGRD